ncbi:DUF4145 domain-containing protein [Chondromyces crocatus]|uniref:DUF4145 domain-containing protein n=1 Tax=Chondromyces crocatus TaxID=52 RepID=A0A0K1E6R1_CHOCO|nr:DUF4145 domain-containing protein [Chondromyces crocatus]AKT36258.1 uncharacterized protein CMC5_003720 [Chondromyces crocatus]
MQCPHCLQHFSPQWRYFTQSTFAAEPFGHIPGQRRTRPTMGARPELTMLEAINTHLQDPQYLRIAICAGCSRSTIEAALPRGTEGGPTFFRIWPQGVARPLPPEVPEEFAEDYREASLVLSASPKASAALSRRALQFIIHKQAGIMKKALVSEIQALIDGGTLPSSIARKLDVIRRIGNLAAHPTEDHQTGAIIPVEPDEAEWLLDVLYDLLDFYFVKQAKDARRTAALDTKLAVVGKPPKK